MGGLIDQVLNTDISGKKARGDAYANQAEATASANDLQREQYDQTRADASPFRGAGISALDRIFGRDDNFTANSEKRKEIEDKLKYAQSELKRHNSINDGTLEGGLTAPRKREVVNAISLNQASVADFQKQLDGITSQQAAQAPQLTPQQTGERITSQDPGYAFRLSEGNKAIEAAASARGRSGGGSTLKDLARYGQDYASNEYGNAYSRLSNLANLGANASAGLASSNANYANQVGGNNLDLSNAYGARRAGDSASQGQDLGLIIRGGTAYATGGASEGVQPTKKLSQLGNRSIENQYESYQPYNMSSFGSRIPRG